MKDSYGSTRINMSCLCEGIFEINGISVETLGESEVALHRGADERLGDNHRTQRRVTVTGISPCSLASFSLRCHSFSLARAPRFERPRRDDITRAIS